MRLTVGPLPPAVYWRRRAIVLGGVLVLVMLIAYACSGSNGTDGDSNGGKPETTAGPSSYPSQDPPSESPSASSSPGEDGDPGGAGDPEPEGPGGPGDAAGDQAGDGIAAGGDVPTCANADLEIKPRPAETQTPVGARLRIYLVISNISDQACERDIGADEQEIWITREGERIWSSDDCNPQRGSYIEVLIPDDPVDKRFYVNWDGRTSAPKCEGEHKVVPEGSYSVRARLGDLNSDPVTIKVVAAS